MIRYYYYQKDEWNVKKYGRRIEPEVLMCLSLDQDRGTRSKKENNVDSGREEYYYCFQIWRNQKKSIIRRAEAKGIMLYKNKHSNKN